MVALTIRRNYPGQESAVIDYYVKNQKALETLSGPVLEEKAVKVIFANEVTMTEKKYSVAEIEKFIEAESERDVLQMRTIFAIISK